jgi:diguanylate cyclase (GGDEF)-like protein
MEAGGSHTAVEVEEARFLIVEDDADYAGYLSLLVESSYPNAKVEVASSIPEALRQLTDASYDVCFLDFFLEPYTGLDVLRTMAFRETTTAFIFLTSNERREDAAEALHFGAMDYLVKSHFAPFDLIKAVSFALYRKRREAELRTIALRDRLTGLGNRALFDEQLRASVARAERNKERLGVALIDLDDFKPVNDTFGHQAGDEVLQAVAKRVLANVRRSDVTARVGGDEFAALLLDVVELSSLLEITEKVRGAIAGAAYPLAGGKEARIGCSIGVASYPDDSTDPAELIRLADARMYEDKRAHKGGR